MIASQKQVSLFCNNGDLKDPSFSSYMNDSTTVLKLTRPPQINTKNTIEDGEIGIFGAEKYFKGAMDEEPIKPPNYHPKNPQENHEEPPKLKPEPATPSVRSESSWNSRSGLLANAGNLRSRRNRKEKTGTVKSLLASLGCNCNDKTSVKIAEKRVHVKEPEKPPAKAGDFEGDQKMVTKREDCFSFPVLSSRPAAKIDAPVHEESPEITRVKTRRNSLEAFGSPILEKGKKSFSLERKLTMLNWDGVTPKAENIDISKNGGCNDAESDASSDLFEIESFSTNGNNSFLARQVSNNATLPHCYAPSEASIAWSVATASVADFSILSDYENPGSISIPKSNKMIKGTGMLSGCTSHKSVRVAGDHLVVGGGGRAAVTVGAVMKERGHNVTPIVKFQAETKPALSSARSPCASHHSLQQNRALAT